VHPIVAVFALFAGENSLDSSEGFFQSLLPACSSSSSWLSGTGGNRSIPINSRQKGCPLNNKQKFYASSTLFFTHFDYAVNVREGSIVEETLFRS
jgi:hypothetical protein